MGNLIVQAFLKYVESHPEVLEQLVEKVVPALVDAIVAHLKAK